MLQDGDTSSNVTVTAMATLGTTCHSRRGCYAPPAAPPRPGINNRMMETPTAGLHCRPDVCVSQLRPTAGWARPREAPGASHCRNGYAADTASRRTSRWSWVRRRRRRDARPSTQPHEPARATGPLRQSPPVGPGVRQVDVCLRRRAAQDARRAPLEDRNLRAQWADCVGLQGGAAGGTR